MASTKRGFASLSPEQRHRIASMGGRAAHAKGTAHQWNSDEARAAGSKGGTVSRGGRGRLRRQDEDRIARDQRERANGTLPVDGRLPVDEPHGDELSRFADEGNPHHD